MEDDVLVLVLVDYPYDCEIKKELLSHSNLHIISLDELANSEVIQKDFYGENLFNQIKRLDDYSTCELEVGKKFEMTRNKKVAFYTCILGDYDELKQPEYVEENCDYYIISDNPRHAKSNMRWIDIDSVVPDRNMSLQEKNRYVKMHPHKIFCNYDISVYMDGSIQLVGPMRQYLSCIGEVGLAIHRHRIRKCIYVESMMVNWLGMIKKKDVLPQIQKYVSEGMPRNWGLFECCVIAVDLSNKLAIKILEEWFLEFKNGAKRDQLSLTYIIWKNGFKPNTIGVLNPKGNVSNNSSIIWERGKKHMNELTKYKGE